MVGVAAALSSSGGGGGGSGSGGGGGGGDAPLPEGGPAGLPTTLLVKAREQAIHSAEVEKWKNRAQSLEARVKGATEARKAWGLREVRDGPSHQLSRSPSR